MDESVIVRGVGWVAPITKSPESGTAVRELLTEALGERYTLEQELGRGGMATVFLARDLPREPPRWRSR